MKSARALLLIVLLAGRSWPPCLAVSSSLFHRVSVSAATVSSSRQLEALSVTPKDFNKFRSSVICSLREWCDLWCYDQATDQSFYSDMIVMPSYNEPNMADALICYTRRHPDFAAGAVIEGTEVWPYAEARVKSNLVDGIYDRKTKDQCFQPTTEDYPWFMLDFGTPVTFRRVKLFVLSVINQYLLNRISNLEVRVGVSPVATLGNFSTFSFFGFFTGPAVPGQEILLEAASPVTARFVSLQKLDLDLNFQLCHIEVY